MNPSHSVPTLSFYSVEMSGFPIMSFSPSTSLIYHIWSSLVWRSLHSSYSNRYLRYASVANKYPGSNDVIGTLSSVMFRRELLDEGSSPFALITTSVVRILISPDCITWNNPSHLSKVYSNLDISLKPSPFYATSFRINGRKYAYFWDLDAGVAMTTQYTCPFPGIRLILSCPDVFLFNAVLHSSSWSMRNRVPAPTDHPHTDQNDMRYRYLYSNIRRTCPDFSWWRRGTTRPNGRFEVYLQTFFTETV